MGNKSGVAEQVISLPKGGGAVKGIGETFRPDLHTGTGNFSIPITVPPGRNGFQPQLTLGYSTGNGNGPFGLGWSLGIPGVMLKTSKGIPKYEGGDTYILSGAEDLLLVADDVVETGQGKEHHRRYRPRTERLFARIVHVTGNGKDHWDVTAKNGITSLYGPDPASRVYDEARPDRIFQWLLVETTDTNGNRIRYHYRREDRAGLDGHRSEVNHAYNQLYLSRVLYANYISGRAEQYLFSVEFDYGEFDAIGRPSGVWAYRPDPFSAYRAGFEIRTARRCRRVLVKLHEERGPAGGRMVKAYRLQYLDELSEQERGEPLPMNGVSLLGGVTLTGFRSDDGNDQVASFPPLTFRYTRFDPEKRRYEAFHSRGKALPERALNAPDYELVDLHGHGLPDVLHTSPGSFRYWRNLGGCRFDAPHPMHQAPAGVSLAESGVQLADMEGTGSADLLVTDRVVSGYYPTSFDAQWDPRSFQAYQRAPSFNLKDPDVRLVDMDGDGVIDVLATGFSDLAVFYNRGKKGWDPHVQRIPRRRLEDFPDVSFSTPDQRVRLAAMSGSGLQDVVVLHDRLIQYWPNLGHGNFGKRLTMANAPRLPRDYDPRRLFLADIDGDGYADLIYVGFDRVRFWINRAGNAWSEEDIVPGTPPVSDQDAVRVADMKGTGTAGILWTYDWSARNGSNYKFLDPTGGVKPYLLAEMDNHLGATTKVGYAPSTKFYLDDLAANRPWKTHLPFPVQVVETVEVVDQLSRGKLTTRYAYHHGYWDGGEREFRGFGYVEQYDTETFGEHHGGGLHGDASGFQAVPERHFSPPTLTKTWFHLGKDVDFWDGAADPTRLRFLPEGLDPKGTREALRTLRGSILRTELYGLDGTALEGMPYTVTENRYRVELVAHNPAAGADPAAPSLVVFPHLRESVTRELERGDDPRVNRTISLYDEFGNVLRQIKIGEPRRPGSGRDLLVLFTDTAFALEHPPSAYIKDRVAETVTRDLSAADRDLIQAYIGGGAQPDWGQLGSVGAAVLARTRHYYDGAAYEGLALGRLDRGNPVRAESLVITPAVLGAAYPAAPAGTYPEPPAALANLAALHYTEDAEGYWAQTVRKRYDVQDSSVSSSFGLVTGLRDPNGNETTIAFDVPYGVFPVRVTDPMGFTTTVDYDYQALAPRRQVDPNANESEYAFDALGMLTALAVKGKQLAGVWEGDELEAPTTRFEYDLHAFQRAGRPVSTHTLQREEHKGATFFETWEYFDGFGRSIQKKVEGEPTARGALFAQQPSGLTLRGSVLYVSDQGYGLIRAIDLTTGQERVVAGTGVPGFGGDGGPATFAQMGPIYSGVAFDSKGSLYIVDRFNYRVRKVDARGIISTVAGTGVPGFSGDGGPATEAQLSQPIAVAVDSSDNLYISDYLNHRVRKVNRQGIITTAVGTGVSGYAGDGGPATSATIGFPIALAFDPSGNLLIGTAPNVVRRVDPNGVITTFAGTGAFGYDGDGGPATAARLAFPDGLWVDPAGTVFIGDRANNRVRRVDQGGTITTVAGSGPSEHGSFGGDGGPATAAQLNNPIGVAADASGNLYIADQTNLRIRRVDAAGTITTFAGVGTGDGGPATSAFLARPEGVALDRSGNLYIAEFGGARIRKLDPAGTVTTVAGNGVSGYSGDGGPGGAAQLNGARDVSVDASGNLYIADATNARVRRVDPSGTITTVAGAGSTGFSGDGGPAAAARLNSPLGVATDGKGNLYIADSGNHRVRKVDPGGVITTVAGNGTAGFFGDGGAATAAQLNGPTGLALDGAGTLYVVDRNNHRVRKVDPGGVITTVAGNGTAGFFGDGGAATAAQLNGPTGLALDGAGTLYVVDRNNDRVRKVDPGGVITTVAGTGAEGYSGDGGPATAAQMRAPHGVARDPRGNLLVSDRNNHRIRLVEGPEGSGTIQTVAGADPNATAARWVGSGWQVYNNKGWAIERYEPFFTPSPSYEGDARQGVHSTVHYDPLGRAVLTINPDGSFRRVVYGIPPNVAIPDEAAPSPWESFSHDENDNGAFFYDANGVRQARPSAEVDALKLRDHLATPSSELQDAWGRRIESREDNGVTGAGRAIYSTRFTYDLLGRTLAVTDPKDRVALRTVYDLTGKALRVVSIDAGIKSTVFDAAGGPVEGRDAKGALVLTSYDRLNRPLATRARDDAAQSIELRELYTYDHLPTSTLAQAQQANSLGRPVRIYDGAGRVELEYDFKGNVLKKTRRVVKDAIRQAVWAETSDKDRDGLLDGGNGFPVTSTFDALNRLRRFTYPDRATAMHFYNEGNLLERLDVGGQPYVETIDYNAKGQRTFIRYGNGVATAYTYDPQTFRLASLMTQKGSATPLQDLRYRYDLVGNVLSVKDRGRTRMENGQPYIANPRDYAYDPTYRLISATGNERKLIDNFAAPDATFVPTTDVNQYQPYERHYTYDEVGNIAAERSTRASNQWTNTFSYEFGINRLAAAQHGASTVPYRFDSAGNMVGMMTNWNYAWDHANHMKGMENRPQASSPTVQATYLYDSAGLRVKKVVRKGNRSETTVYLDGVFEEFVARSASTVKERKQLKHVAYGTQRIALLKTAVVSSTSDPEPPVLYQHEDHVGSSHVVTKDDGSFFNQEEYYPYGTSSFGSYRVKRHRFNGKERDQESGLNYHRARYYAPWLGRWMSCDPAGILDGPNLYAYARANPLRLIDPTGLQAERTDDSRYADVYKDAFVEEIVVVAPPETDATAGSKGGHRFDRQAFAEGLLGGLSIGLGAGLGFGLLALALPATVPALIGIGIVGLGFTAYAALQTWWGRDLTGQRISDEQRSRQLGGIVGGAIGGMMGGSMASALGSAIGGGGGAGPGIALAAAGGPRGTAVVAAEVAGVLAGVPASGAGAAGAIGGYVHMNAGGGFPEDEWPYDDSPVEPTEKCKTVEDAVGLLNEKATIVDKVPAKNENLIKLGFTERWYVTDSSGRQYSVHYNPNTREFTGGKLSTSNFR